MAALVDTSVLIDAERGAVDFGGLVASYGAEPIAVAAVTAAELLHGVQRLRGIKRARAEQFVEAVLELLPVQPFDLQAARVHAALSVELAERGTPVGPHDLLIAATAVSLGYDVATRDLRSFPKVRGLKVLRW